MHPTHWLIYAQVVAVLDVGVKLAHDVLSDITLMNNPTTTCVAEPL